MEENRKLQSKNSNTQTYERTEKEAEMKFLKKEINELQNNNKLLLGEVETLEYKYKNELTSLQQNIKRLEGQLKNANQENANYKINFELAEQKNQEN